MFSNFPTLLETIMCLDFRRIKIINLVTHTEKWVGYCKVAFLVVAGMVLSDRLLNKR